MSELVVSQDVVEQAVSVLVVLLYREVLLNDLAENDVVSLQRTVDVGLDLRWKEVSGLGLKSRQINTWVRQVLLKPAAEVDLVVGVKPEAAGQLDSGRHYSRLVLDLLLGDWLHKLTVFVFDTVVGNLRQTQL